MDNEINLIKNDISKMLKINSTQSDKKENMPFGNGPAQALNLFLNIATSMGFQTINYDNYVGEIVFGEGKDFAILAHLDVVPAGNGWTKDPYSGEIDEKSQKI